MIPKSTNTRFEIGWREGYVMNVNRTNKHKTHTGQEKYVHEAGRKGKSLFTNIAAYETVLPLWKCERRQTKGNQKLKGRMQNPLNASDATSIWRYNLFHKHIS